ncbi:TetR/AcrR family transcriptional regulator [Streptomyces smyrnaeus]|uniref:TetR/AcrR family transcriptional regulator n=1 Tax=Streptomyces TaxID=1883 RepID=UPI000C174202|nr:MULTISPECIES: TetR family transcriptional regulator [unclassified Streptomyces]MBQ0868314.1 TetR family transcriptional regulator [Streptomyces sp. RK75]MBQ1119727.1 TetR family transcriptional regulator [Streptomyces sp. B15]MBQ1157360.1 TetR family transcriptional regulator [Streptomyces sp. A73]
MAPARTESADDTAADTDLPPAKPSLRERKKIQTRQAIRRTAYRLFEEQGYDATPVDQIAEEAEVSPSTVFRYFPTKEDIVLTDEYDPLIEETLRQRPPNEPPVAALREALYSSIARIYQADAAETLQRVRLIREVPALRGRMSEHSAETAWLLRRALAERTGRAEDDLELRIVTGAMLGALMEAMYSWVDTGTAGTLEDLRALVTRALGVLERGLTL